MESKEILREKIKFLKGKTIALVYIFEGDDSNGFSHFFIWKSNILSKWMNAIQELHCLPLIIDVRTFVDKAINKTLPHIDFVLNMNSGTNNLSTMALVPSTCSSIGVPCIPCDAVSIVTGENKLLSNLIAKGIGINVPKDLKVHEKNGIFRPISLGNSLGVTRGINPEYNEGIYQEFIEGYEITTPVVYNPISEQMDFLPTVMYLPENQDLTWFNGAEEKIKREDYIFKIVNIDGKIKANYLKLIQSLSLKCFCRIDARVKCNRKAFYHVEENTNISSEDLYFVEINVMPTIREKNNFYYSFNNINTSSTLGEITNIQKEIFGEINLYKFLLINSMLAYL